MCESSSGIVVHFTVRFGRTEIDTVPECCGRPMTAPTRATVIARARQRIRSLFLPEE